MDSAKRRMIGFILVALIQAGCIGTTTPSDAPVDREAPGVWVILAPMPSQRSEVAVAEAGGKVYVVGGFGDGLAPVGTVEAYDPGTNRWEERAPLAIQVHHPAAVGLNGMLSSTETESFRPSKRTPLPNRPVSQVGPLSNVPV